MNVDQQIAAIIAREGGYVNNPADKGGATCWGITQAVARANGYTGDMSKLLQATAVAIYKAEYWAEPRHRFDLVSGLVPSVAAEMFDTGVNCGVGTAAKMLQRALFVLQGAALTYDGAIIQGGATMMALGAYMGARRAKDGEANLLKLLNCFQGERYAELVEHDPSQRAFVNGWIANRIGGVS